MRFTLGIRATNKTTGLPSKYSWNPAIGPLMVLALITLIALVQAVQLAAGFN